MSPVVQQRVRGRREDSGNHPVAQDAALRESSDRVEGHPDHRLAGTRGDHRHQRDGVAAKIYDSIGGGALQPDGPLQDRGDPHQPILVKSTASSNGTLEKKARPRVTCAAAASLLTTRGSAMTIVLPWRRILPLPAAL